MLTLTRAFRSNILLSTLRFLAGCRSLDHHFLTAAPRSNLPYLLGLLGVWNSNFLGFRSRALACYSEAMLKLAPHIQQVDMESNGKRVTTDGKVANFSTGEGRTTDRR